MAPPRIVPDVPLFDVSTHDLYAVAHGLIESDVDREFCQRLFKELVKWHGKVGREKGSGEGNESFWKGELTKVSSAVMGRVPHQWMIAEAYYCIHVTNGAM